MRTEGAGMAMMRRGTSNTAGALSSNSYMHIYAHANTAMARAQFYEPLRSAILPIAATARRRTILEHDSCISATLPFFVGHATPMAAAAGADD